MKEFVKKIVSARNPLINHCVKLREKARYREENRRVVLIGKEILEELQCAKLSSLKTRTVFITEEKNLEMAKNLTSNVFLISDHVMEKLSGLKSAESVQVVAEVDLPVWKKEWMSSRVLVLDGIQDPGNLGTLLRTCLSFQWQPVLLLPNCCDPYNEKVLRAARGASFSVPIYRVDIHQLRTLIKEKNLYTLAAAPSAGSKCYLKGFYRGFQLDDRSKCLKEVLEEGLKNERDVCLFLGSEGQGISDEVQALCENSIFIETSYSMESVNVAVAGGILMYLLRTPGKQKFNS